MRKQLFFTAIIFLALAGITNAQVDRTKKPQAGPPPKIVIGDYQTFTMANGLRVIVVENHKLPKVTYSMVFDYNPVMEGKEQGFVDFTGSLLGTGSKNRTKDQINQEIDFIGAEMNFSTNGCYATCLKKHNEKMLDLLTDALIYPKFTQEELNKVLTQAQSGLASAKTEPQAIAERVGRIVMYGKDHPYGYSMTEESVKQISLENCNNFYSSYIRPNNSYLAVVGDITLAEAKPLIEKYFSGWKEAPVPSTIYPAPEAPATRLVELVDRPVAVQSLVRVEYPVNLKVGDPDYIKARIANTVLGGGTFRLFNNLREAHGYTYGAYSQLSPDKFVGNFAANAEVRTVVTDSAITQILFEMKRMTEEKVPADELDLVKNYASGTFALSLEKPETVATFALNIERFGLPHDYYANYLKNIAAVTPDDVLLVSQKYIKPNNAHILVIGKGEDIAAKLKVFASSQKIDYYDVDGNSYDPSKKSKPLPAGITAKQVTENYLTAIGGRKELAKIKDVTMNMGFVMQGMSISIKMYRKVPDMMMVDVSSSGMTLSKQIYDGKKAVVTSPQGSEELTGEDLESMKYQAILNLEMDYDKYGVKTELSGIEEIKGKDAYKMEIAYPNGVKETEWYDIATGLKIRTLSKEGPQDLNDYRDVKGIKFPFQLVKEMGGQEMKLNVDSIEINTKIKDDIFKI
ncbi:MAG: pitrilysin family protein [Bacteroidota bacterium]